MSRGSSGTVWITAAVLALTGPGRAGAQQRPGFSLQGSYGAGQLIRGLSSDPDATYGAILGIQVAGPIAGELEYQHTQNHVNGAGSGGTLRQEGAFWHLRLDLTTRALAPFVYSGLGWVHYSSGPAVNVTADRAVVPFGAGLDLRPLRHVIVGVRGEYQWIPKGLAGNNTDYWKVLGTAGFTLP